MSSDSENKPWPAKRRRTKSKINADSSDDSDNSVVRTLRHRVVFKRANTNEAAGTSQPAVESEERRLEIASISGRRSTVETNRPNSTSPKLGISPIRVMQVAATSSKLSDDEQGEQCPICLIVFVNQEVASPSSCQHFFCVPCLMEWSKNTNTCPVDRKSFASIDVRPKFGDNVERQIPVQVTASSDSDEIGPEDENSMGDDFVIGVGPEARAIMAGILRIPLRTFSSSSGSSPFSHRADRPDPIDLLNDSSDEGSSPAIIEPRSSSTDEEEEEGSSRSFVHVSSPSDNKPSSPLEIRHYPGPSENGQLSSSPERQRISSSLENVQVSSPERRPISSSSEDVQLSTSSSEPSSENLEQLSSPRNFRQLSSPSEPRPSWSSSEKEQVSSPPELLELSSPSSSPRRLSSSLENVQFSSPSVNREISSRSVSPDRLSYSPLETDRSLSSSDPGQRYSFSSDKQAFSPSSENSNSSSSSY